jgi:hypothetical protein
MRTARVVLPFCAALTGALAIGASPARAQGTADDAAGIALFNEGKALRDSGDWEHAALKFAEAERLHPAAAILFNLAEADEHLNRLASAWGAWKDAEIMARNAHDASREQEAAARGAALAPKLAKLAIVIPPATRVPGLELRKDGALVGEGQWGSGLPADVGQHTIEASAPGHKAWSTVVRIETNGSSASVEVPALDVLATPTGEAPPSFWGTQRIVGVSVGAVGLVGLAVATGLGVDAIQKNNASKAQCLPNNPSLCFPAGTDLRLSAGRAADASTALFVVGGAAVAAGLTVFFTAPSSSAPKATTGGLRGVELAPAVGPTSAALSLRGRW